MQSLVRRVSLMMQEPQLNQQMRSSGGDLSGMILSYPLIGAWKNATFSTQAESIFPPPKPFSPWPKPRHNAHSSLHADAWFSYGPANVATTLWSHTHS
jgi:hypothetical protein